MARPRRPRRSPYGDDYQPGPYAPPRGAAAAPAPQAAQEPYSSPYDYNADPILQRIRALGQQRLADAQAEALRLRRETALEYGDEGLARELGLSDADIAAARDNPFSIRAKLAKARKEEPAALDVGINRQGGFYSSERGRQQSELASSLLERESGAASAVRERLSGIQRGLLDTQREIEEGNVGAEEDAASRLRERLGNLSLQRPVETLAARVTPRPAAIGPARRAVRRVGPVPRRGIRY